jgi:hypothetical protein
MEPESSLPCSQEPSTGPYSELPIRMIKSESMILAMHVAHMGKKRSAYKVSVEKPEEKRPHERPIRRWEDNIKTDLKEIRCEDVYWIQVPTDRD